MTDALAGRGLDPRAIREWITALPEDAIAQVVRAYTDADWAASGLSGDPVDLGGVGRSAFAARAFRDALLSLAPKVLAQTQDPGTQKTVGGDPSS